MLVVVGLGNPGDAYADHRHNIGFRVVDAFAHGLEAPPWRGQFSGLITRHRNDKLDVMLAKPQTYMNRSGDCVAPLLHYYRVQSTDLVVVHDELDLPFGTVRVKVGGGHAGHNGLRSIMQHLGDAPFVRLRIGIGKPALHFDSTADFVLSSFNSEERAQLDDLLKRSVSALRTVIRWGPSEAMNRINVRHRPPKPPKLPKNQAQDAAAASPIVIEVDEPTDGEKNSV